MPMLLHRSLPAQPLHSRRLTTLVLILILWLGWGLYLFRLDAQSLWYDEGVTATIAQRPLAALTAWTARDIQPPLYYYLVAGWGRVAGWSEWSLRFVSAWWGLLTVALLSALTKRLTAQHRAGLIAALLTALHPLLLYYSQEARMYTQLVALGVLAGYLLLRVRTECRPRLWVAYLLTAAAAVYTHYFAFFLLLGLGVAYLVDCFVTGRRASQPSPTDNAWQRLLLPFLLTNGGVLLLYGSWVATLFNQLDTDASYWQGPFKLWDALGVVALSFVGGESMRAAQAGAGLIMAGLALVVALVALAQGQPQFATSKHRLLLYCLPWLLLPIGGVLALAAFVPKFNARYVMLALPALLVLWSGGLATLLTFGSVNQATAALPLDRTRRLGQWVVRMAALVLLAALLVTFGRADYNWFTDRSFTKAQWREISRFVRDERTPEEAVVLVSGHAWPVWDYYAPDLPTVRLPDLEILNVDAVLDYTESALALQSGLASYSGAWLVTWQDEVVDPMGVTALHLGIAGEEEAVDGRFWQLGLRYFDEINHSLIAAAAPLEQQLAINFANQLILTGYAQAPNADLLLFWQLAPGVDNAGLNGLLPDLRISLGTSAANDLPYADPPDRRPADYNYAVPRWRPHQMVVGRITATEWAGAAAMPGAYQLHLGLYDPNGDPAGLDRLAEDGIAQGKSVALDLTLAQPTAAAALSLPETIVTLAPGLQVAFATDQSRAEPGEPFLLTLYWRAAVPLEALPSLVVQWQPQAGDASLVTTPLILPSPLDSFQRQWLRQVVQVKPPLTLTPGAYQLSLGRVGAPVSDTALPFTIRPSTRLFVLPPLAVTTTAELFSPSAPDAAELQLSGLTTALPTTLTPTQPLTLTLVWQAPATGQGPQVDYNVSLQLLGPNGLPVTQRDEALPLGSSTWLPTQVVTQTLTLPPLPATPPPSGPYRLIVAVYAPSATSTRLQTAAGADYVELAGQIAVP